MSTDTCLTVLFTGCTGATALQRVHTVVAHQRLELRELHLRADPRTGEVVATLRAAPLPAHAEQQLVRRLERITTVSRVERG